MDALRAEVLRCIPAADPLVLSDLGLGARTRAVASPARLGGVPEDGGDGVGIVELPGGDANHQVVGLVVGQGQPSAVKAGERDDRGKRKPLLELPVTALEPYSLLHPREWAAELQGWVFSIANKDVDHPD